MRRTLRGLLIALAVATGIPVAVNGQEAGSKAGPTAPRHAVSSVPFGCDDRNFVGGGQLPNLKEALQDGGRVRILSIGGSSFVGHRGARGSPDLRLASILNAAVQGLDVQIINRGVSGELARQAAERIKLEAGLEEPTVVLWQVGTADTFARIPIDEFSQTLRTTLRWLKERDIDVVLVGLHYLREWTTDKYVQAIRAAVRRVANEEKVLRIGRFEAEEVIAKAAWQPGQRRDVFSLTEAGYDCLADYLARAITVGLYAKGKPEGDGLRQRP